MRLVQWQQRLRHIRGLVLEAGRPSDLHPGPPLARGGVRQTSGESHQAHVEQHDRELRQAVCGYAVVKIDLLLFCFDNCFLKSVTFNLFFFVRF